ncbi:MAG: hypothetical protein ACR2F2_08530 [Pyrinomonadaceae bacterium]
MRVKLLVLGLVLLGSFYNNVSSQTEINSKQNNKDEQNNSTAQKSLNLRIIQVLYQTADEVRNLDDAKASANIQAKIADLLWNYDPISAKSILIKGWDKAKQVKETDAKSNRFRNTSNRIDGSREILLVARKREPELAEKWLKELADLTEEDFAERNKGLFDDRTARSAVLLQMALQIVETDVNAAASLAVESLRDGISFGFQAVLIKIQEKNMDLAVQVFRAALQRVNSAGISNANEIQILYSYLYSPGIVSTTANATSSDTRTISVGRNRSQIAAAAGLYPALAREFLQIAAQAILRMPFLIGDTDPETAAREQFGIISTILYQLGNSSPELSRALQNRLAEITANANFTPDAPNFPSDVTPGKQNETRDEYRERLLDEILEKAEKIADSLARDIFIAQGVLRSEAEQFEKAKSIAEKIDDKELRTQIINFLIFRTSLDLIKKDRLSEAYKISQKNSEPIHQSVVLIVGGQKLIERKDYLPAREWILEAEKMFDKNNTNNEDWANIGFGLATSYSHFDKISALKILEKSGKLITKDSINYNRDKSPDAFGFSGLNFSDFTVNTKEFSLNSAIKSFPKENFEDVLLAVNEIKNLQAKGLAIVVLAEKNLQQPQINSK